MDALESTIEPLSYQEPEEEVAEFEEDAVRLARVGGSKQWQIIEDYCLDRIANYRDDLAGLDIKGLPLAQVGEKYLVCNLVAMELEALLNKVRVTTDAVNEPRSRS